MERHECIGAVRCPDADLRLLPADARVVRSDHDVGGEKERVRMRSDIAFGGDDEPLREPPWREEITGMDPVLVLDRRRLLTTDGLGRHLLDVVARGEIGALGGEDDALHVVHAITVREDGVELLLHGAVDRVHLLWPIQANLDDVRPPFHLDAGHRIPLRVNHESSHPSLHRLRRQIRRQSRFGARGSPSTCCAMMLR